MFIAVACAGVLADSALCAAADYISEEYYCAGGLAMACDACKGEELCGVCVLLKSQDVDYQFRKPGVCLCARGDFSRLFLFEGKRNFNLCDCFSGIVGHEKIY